MLKFLHSQSRTIIGAATLVGVLSFVSRLVGFVRDRILAGAFGAGDTLDIYYAAFKIPDLLFTLITVGAVSASFIPIFLSHYHQPLGEERAWRFTNNVLHLLVGGMLALSVLLILFAQPLAELVAPGFPALKQLRVASFMRIMFVAQALLAASMVYGSVLQSLKKFFLFSLAPIVYNVGIIVGALWLVDVLGVWGLAWGVVLGAGLHLCVQLYGAHKSGYRYAFYADVRSKDAREMLALMGPRMLGLAVGQLMVLVLAIIATTLPAGSLTIFQFAYNIQFFAVGIIGVSFAIAAFPSLSESAQQGDTDGFVDTIATTTRQLLYLLVPMTLLFLIVRAQIVRVVVGAGAFDWPATIATADTLAFFTLTFIPQSLVFLFARAFYALRDTVTPLAVALVSALTGVLGALLLREAFGVVSLAMAYSLSALVNAALLWVSLRQRTGTLREAALVPLLFKLALCAMGSGIVMQLLKPVVTSVLTLDSFVGVFLQGFIAGGIGLLAYVLLAHVLRVPEQQRLWAGIRRRALSRARVQEAVSET